jgi:hypothetical protein
MRPRAKGLEAEVRRIRSSWPESSLGGVDGKSGALPMLGAGGTYL